MPKMKTLRKKIDQIDWKILNLLNQRAEVTLEIGSLKSKGTKPSFAPEREQQVYEKVIKGAVFYDVGNVWRRLEDYFSGGFKHGAGAGIRVKTPLGPLKLDCGYPLSDNQNDEKRLEWYFSMSHGF